MKTKIVILALALILAAARVAWAGEGVGRARAVLGGGATDGGATGVTLRATVGQPVVGLVTGGGAEVALGQGFWGGGIIVAVRHGVYVPVVVRGAP